jgi:hypothetical protein
VAIDLTAAGVDCNARIAFIISPVFRYIEYFKAFFFTFGDVLVDGCQRGRGWPGSSGDRRYSWPSKAPSQAVIWLGSWVLQVIRNMTRQ